MDYLYPKAADLMERGFLHTMARNVPFG